MPLGDGDYWRPLGPPRWQDTPVAYNGLCQCRGPLDLHPFHGSTGGFISTTAGLLQLAPYEGRHRRTD